MAARRGGLADRGEGGPGRFSEGGRPRTPSACGKSFPASPRRNGRSSDSNPTRSWLTSRKWPTRPRASESMTSSTSTTEPLIPRGWLARLPDSDKVAGALERLLKLLGPPTTVARRSLSTIEQALTEAAAEVGAGVCPRRPRSRPDTRGRPAVPAGGCRRHAPPVPRHHGTTDRPLSRLDEGTGRKSQGCVRLHCLVCPFQEGNAQAHGAPSSRNRSGSTREPVSRRSCTATWPACTTPYGRS